MISTGARDAARHDARSVWLVDASCCTGSLIDGLQGHFMAAKQVLHGLQGPGRLESGWGEIDQVREFVAEGLAQMARDAQPCGQSERTWLMPACPRQHPYSSSQEKVFMESRPL